QGLARERRSCVEQGLSPALDLGASLHVLEPQQIGKTGMAERALDEAGGTRPAAAVDLEVRIGAIPEEARDRDVRQPDVAEQESIARELALEIIERGGDILVERLLDALLIARFTPHRRPDHPLV